MDSTDTAECLHMLANIASCVGDDKHGESHITCPNEVIIRANSYKNFCHLYSALKQFQNKGEAHVFPAYDGKTNDIIAAITPIHGLSITLKVNSYIEGNDFLKLIEETLNKEE